MSRRKQLQRMEEAEAIYGLSATLVPAYAADTRRQKERSCITESPKKSATAIGHGSNHPDVGTVRTLFTPAGMSVTVLKPVNHGERL